MFLPLAALLLTRSLAAKIGHLQQPLAARKPLVSKYHLQGKRPVAEKNTCSYTIFSQIAAANLQPNVLFYEIKCNLRNSFKNYIAEHGAADEFLAALSELAASAFRFNQS